MDGHGGVELAISAEALHEGLGQSPFYRLEKLGARTRAASHIPLALHRQPPLVAGEVKADIRLHRFAACPLI